MVPIHADRPPGNTAAQPSPSLVGSRVASAPQLAPCTASTDIACAVLTREALEALIAEQPALGAKFLLAVSAGIAERYRPTQ